jgi:hypothetical protein
VYDVVLLTLGSDRDAPGGCGGCAGSAGGGACGTAAEGVTSANGTATDGGVTSAGGTGTGGADNCAGGSVRVPVLRCADALGAAGARVETVTAYSDTEIDAVLARLDGPARPDGLAWPDADSKVRLVLATASDAQTRAVVRRLVRRYAPPPSRRPADLPENRTVPDLPPVALLPLDPASGPGGGDLVARLGLPRRPEEVARAVLDGRTRRLDLLRNDGGSVTLDGALVGGADDAGRPRPWRGRVEVDDAVLSAGDDPLLGCVVGNATGYATVDGVPLVPAADPTDGVVDVAVAIPVVTRSPLGRKRVRVQVRRARGRAVAVHPRDGAVPYLDDGVGGELTRKRSWWIEPGAWAVYDR